MFKNLRLKFKKLFAIPVANEQGLIKAIEKSQKLPWWRPRVVVVTRNVTITTDLTIPKNITLFLDGFLGVNDKIHNPHTEGEESEKEICT